MFDEPKLIKILPNPAIVRNRSHLSYNNKIKVSTLFSPIWIYRKLIITLPFLYSNHNTITLQNSLKVYCVSMNQLKGLALRLKVLGLYPKSHVSIPSAIHRCWAQSQWFVFLNYWETRRMWDLWHITDCVEE